jgi:hypothetical protein
MCNEKPLAAPRRLIQCVVLTARFDFKLKAADGARRFV